MGRENIVDYAERKLEAVLEYCEETNNPYVVLARDLQDLKVIGAYRDNDSKVPNDFG